MTIKAIIVAKRASQDKRLNGIFTFFIKIPSGDFSGSEYLDPDSVYILCISHGTTFQLSVLDCQKGVIRYSELLTELPGPPCV